MFQNISIYLILNVSSNILRINFFLLLLLDVCFIFCDFFVFVFSWMLFDPIFFVSFFPDTCLVFSAAVVYSCFYVCMAKQHQTNKRYNMKIYLSYFLSYMFNWIFLPFKHLKDAHEKRITKNLKLCFMVLFKFK